MLKGTMNKVKLVAIAVISLVVLIVVLQNTQAVETNLLFLTVTMPNAALLFGTLIIGFVIGVLMRAARKPNAETALFWSAPVGRSQTCVHAARMSQA